MEQPQLGDLLTMVINHLLNGMILQVGGDFFVAHDICNITGRLHQHLPGVWPFKKLLGLTSDAGAIRKRLCWSAIFWDGPKVEWKKLFFQMSGPIWMWMIIILLPN